jgi:hypothetical protein
MARRPPSGFSSWSSYYHYRLRRGADRGLTSAQARGHPRAGEPRASEIERDVVIVGRSGAQVTTVVGVQQLSLAGAADNALGDLRAGRITPEQWNRRWAGKTIGNVILPDAARMLALSRAGLADIDDFYPRSPGAVA